MTNTDIMDMSNFRLTVSYDGRAFIGWQRHGNKPTVQHALEQAIEQQLGVRVPVRGSGRTDKGAHARGQVASVELPADCEPGNIVDALNYVLPDQVRVLDAQSVPAEFHACDSAVGKRYRYVIWNHSTVPEELAGRVWHVKSKLDVDAMADACSVFIGKHDFASFATKSNFKQKNTTRIVTDALLSHDLPTITFDICANGFLYKMVRNIVRAIVKVGEGRYSRKDLVAILAAKSRQAAPGTAPASGLYLERVFYSQEEMREDERIRGR